jgi:Fic family protein
MTLKKAFHDPNAHERELYRERFSAGSTIHLDLHMGGSPAFCVMNDDIYTLMLKLAKADKRIMALSHSLPGKALTQFSERTLIDEIVLTNGIEGVNSSRKQIGDILRNLEKRNKRQRFYGLVNKYAMLSKGASIPLCNPEDIRKIYDDLVLAEVKADKSENAPDGQLFRKDSVSVYDAAGQEIHQGVQPESRIYEYLTTSLEFLNNDRIDKPVQIAIFHYLLGYIHPFYDGNGRLNRFISSYLLMHEYEALIGFRLSYAITQSIDRYYKGFAACNDPLNKGDLTPFVLMFLSIIEKAAEDIVSSLTEKEQLLGDNVEHLSKIDLIAKNEDLHELASVLLQVRMFSGNGITATELMGIFKVSRPTLTKRLNDIASLGLLQRERMGREVRFQINLETLTRVSQKSLAFS